MPKSRTRKRTPSAREQRRRTAASVKVAYWKARHAANGDPDLLKQLLFGGRKKGMT